MTGLAINRRRALGLAGAAAVTPALAAVAGALAYPVPSIPGPRRRIAVEQAGPGAGLLAAALIRSGGFDVVAQGPATGGAVADFRRPQYLIAGSLADEETPELRLVEARNGKVISAFRPRRGSAAGAAVLHDAVSAFALALAGHPWRGRVTGAQGGLVQIDAGRSAGLAVGDRLSLQRVTETSVDRASGAVLGENTVEIGVMTLAGAAAAAAWGPHQSAAGTHPARGDFVILHAG